MNELPSASTSVLMTPIEQAPFVAKYLAWGILAGTGGAVKFVSASLKSKNTLSPRRFLILLSANVFISGFSGLMGALLFSEFSSDHTLQLISAGVFGYIGTQTLDIIALTMNKKITDSSLPISAVIPIPSSVDPAVAQPVPVPVEKE